ncbi:MAG: MFS transporter [Blastomonas sp.]
MPDQDIRALIKDSPMRWQQFVAVALCILANAGDGFDSAVMAFAAPSITSEWGIASSVMGIVFGVLALGTMAGAFLIAPLADRFGRRALILSASAFLAVMMGLVPFAQDVTQLIILRFLTGVGVGVIFPNLNILVIEYSNNRLGNILASTMHMGFAAGLAICSAVAATLIGTFGWQSVFFFGAAINLVVFFAGLYFLPESLDFILAKRPAGALQKLNRKLVRWGHAPLEALPPAEDSGFETRSLRELIASRTIWMVTLLLGIAALTHYFCSHFKINWSPKILLEAGVDTGAALSSGMLMGLGSALGTLGYGKLVSSRHALWWITAGYMISAVLILAIGEMPADPAMLLISLSVLSFFLVGSWTGLLIYATRFYPPAMRGAGMGFMIGIGRFGGMAGSYTAGVLMDFGWERADFFPVYTLASIIGGAAIIAIVLLQKSAAITERPA